MLITQEYQNSTNSMLNRDHRRWFVWCYALLLRLSLSKNLYEHTLKLIQQD